MPAGDLQHMVKHEISAGEYNTRVHNVKKVAFAVSDSGPALLLCGTLQ